MGGVGCKMPVDDQFYQINNLGGLKFGDFGVKRPNNGYIDQVVKRAKSSIDPRKYSKITDWKK